VDRDGQGSVVAAAGAAGCCQEFEGVPKSEL
jgi:hypothetical protein